MRASYRRVSVIIPDPPSRKEQNRIKVESKGTKRTLHTQPLTLLHNPQRLLHIDAIAIYDHLLSGVEPDGLVHRDGAGCEDERVARVLAEAGPAGGARGGGGEVLRGREFEGVRSRRCEERKGKGGEEGREERRRGRRGKETDRPCRTPRLRTCP